MSDQLTAYVVSKFKLKQILKQTLKLAKIAKSSKSVTLTLRSRAGVVIGVLRPFQHYLSHIKTIEGDNGRHCAMKHNHELKSTTIGI